jgi:nucleoside-diphosphate-sugar epimerase
MRPDDRPGEDEERESTPDPEDGGTPVEGPSGLTVLHEDDLEDEIPQTVLITGANGNIGRKLREAWAGVYDLILIDKEADPANPAMIAADLSEMEDAWMQKFHGVDTVIHLAANPSEFASWEELEKPNLDALCNVFLAAALAAVDRVIFASSNHAMGDYRDLGDMPITVDLAPRPDGPYGAAKWMGERLGKSCSDAFDMSVIALRIGWVQKGDNRPETLPDDWSRSIWLSNADMVRLFECAVESDLDERRFVVVNGLSNNRGTRWDLGEAAEVLGFYPEDDAYAEEL